MRRAALLIVAFQMMQTCAFTQSSGFNDRKGWKLIQDYSVESLLYARAHGSVILSGTCEPSDGGRAVFTGFISQPPTHPAIYLDQALNYLSSVQPSIIWSRQQDGAVHILDTRANVAVLGLPLKRVDIDGVTDMQDAIDQITQLPEVRKYTLENHLQLMQTFSQNRIFGQALNSRSPASSSPAKFSLHLHNVTVRKALDMIALDFSGVWVYSECQGKFAITARQTGIPLFWRKVSSNATRHSDP